MKDKRRYAALLLGAILAASNMSVIEAQAINMDESVVGGGSRIHIIALNGEDDAILLESQGRFGMIDSGEDSDYPDGSNPAYPFRTGTTMEAGYEEQVISYMHSVGVTKDNFDFYLGTHPHSDHIGSADEVIHEFEPERVYMMEYKDEYISESKNLFDNLYVYDHLIQAAKDVGAVLIQNFDENAPVIPQIEDEEDIPEVNNTGETGESKENPEGDSTGETGESEKNPEEDSTGETGESEENPEEDSTGETGESEENPEEDSIGEIEGIEENPEVDNRTGETGEAEENPEGEGEPVQDDRNYEYLSPEDIQAKYDVDPMDPNDPQAADEVPNDGAGIPVLLSTEPNSTLDIQPQSTTGNPVFMLGDMEINVINYSDDYKTVPKPDANYFSLGVIVNVNGTRSFLAGDMGNYDGDEDRLASLIGRVDILKIGHHGYASSSTTSFLNTLTPRYAVQTGRYRTLSGSQERMNAFEDLAKKYGTQLFSVANYSFILDSIVFDLSDGSVKTNIPEDEVLFMGCMSEPTLVCYKNGYRFAYTGFVNNSGKTYFFNDSPVVSKGKWERSGGKWYYFGKDGAMYTGLKTIGNRIYYLDDSGAMQTGWQQVNNARYYFSADGSAVTGWQTINNKKEFFEYDGVWVKDPLGGTWIKNKTGWWYKLKDGTYPANCWKTIDNKRYYFDSRGYMVTGWKKFNDSWYYLKQDGSMAVGWQKVGNIWYYMNEQGVMQTGWEKIYSKMYYFETNGYMTSGWKKLDNKWYYFGGAGDGSMKTGWQKVSNKWYYMDASGVMQTQWQKIGQNTYYFDGSGAMATGWKYIENKWYYFGSAGDGSMKTGWQKVGNKWYIMDKDGVMQTGWIDKSGKKYYFDGSGAMVTGWKSISGKWYYFGTVNDGSMKTGWQKVGGKWYYMDAAGVMQTGWTEKYGKKYYLDGSGAMVTGWRRINSKWYYFGTADDGSMKTGWQKIGKEWYLLDNSGVMQTGWVGNYYLNSSGVWIQGKKR